MPKHVALDETGRILAGQLPDGVGGGFAMMVTNGSIAGNFTITPASEIAASEARIMTDSFIRYREI